MAESTPPPDEKPRTARARCVRLARTSRRSSGVVQRLPSLPSDVAYEVTPEALLTACRTLRDAPELSSRC